MNSYTGKLHPTTVLIRRSISVVRRREPDAVVRNVVYLVEPLEERHAIDEVEALAAVATQVGHDEVDIVWRASERRVELRAGKVRTAQTG